MLWYNFTIPRDHVMFSLVVIHLGERNMIKRICLLVDRWSIYTVACNRDMLKNFHNEKGKFRSTTILVRAKSTSRVSYKLWLDIVLWRSHGKILYLQNVYNKFDVSFMQVWYHVTSYFYDYALHRCWSPTIMSNPNHITMNQTWWTCWHQCNSPGWSLTTKDMSS